MGLGFGEREKEFFIMDIKSLYRQFNDEFWDYFLSSEKARNRKGITWGWWAKERTPMARKAMHTYLKTYGAPNENPFYWVKRFPEPEPTNYNGAHTLPKGPLVRAIYKGAGGIYTREEAEEYGMEIKGDFVL